MSETINAQQMALLLDEWVADQHPFNPGFAPSFGLSDEQRLEPLVKAAATFAGFAFMGDRDNESYVGPFVPVFDDGPELLTYIKNEHPEAFGQWHDLSTHVGDPFLTAKLQDLLWLVRYDERQQPAQYARDAIESYLRFYDEALSRNFTHKQLHLCHLLSRVAELAKEINAADQFHGPLGERCQAWLESIPVEDHIWPIKVAARLLEQYRPADLRDYIRALHAHYAASGDWQRRTLAEGLFELELAIATTDDERARVREAAAEMFLAEAHLSGQATFTLAHLERAGKWAQGAAGESRLTREINDIRRTLDLSADLKEISIEVPILGHEMRQLREWIVEPDDYRDSLYRLTAFGASWLLDLDGLQDRLRRVRGESCLFDLVSVTHIHRDGFECCGPATSSEERQQKELAGQHEALAISAAKLWLADGLDAIRVRYALGSSTVVEFVTQHGLVEQVDGEAFGRAFQHYWNGDYDSAANVALPRIESALRGIAHRAGEVIISLPDAGRRKCGGYKPLGAILPRLKDHLGEDAVKMLQLLLVDNHGMNLRNNYAHGIQSEDPQADAAISLWIALWLSFLHPGDG